MVRFPSSNARIKRIGENTATKVWRDMILRAVSIVKPKKGSNYLSKFDADFPLFSLNARRSLENFVYFRTDLGGKFHHFETLKILWTERTLNEITASREFTDELLKQKRYMIGQSFPKKMALDLMFSVIVMFIGSNSSESTYADEEKKLMLRSEDKRVQSYMEKFFKNE